MNYSKIILVGFISAFVAVLTSVLGVAGTIIGSVISSVLYNMLSEALEKPVSDAVVSRDFEWDIAYVFPLVVIAIIQLMLIFAMLAEYGILPSSFLNLYLSLQDFASNNLYRILGLALIIMSAYPFVLKPENVKVAHGIILGIVGVIFLARGCVDITHPITDLYDQIFMNFDFPIAIIAFALIVIVIVRILYLSRKSDNEPKVISSKDVAQKYFKKPAKAKNDSSKSARFERNKWVNQAPKKKYESDVNFKNKIRSSEDNVESQEIIVEHDPGINQSSENIRFESNDLLDEYK